MESGGFKKKRKNICKSVDSLRVGYIHFTSVQPSFQVEKLKGFLQFLLCILTDLPEFSEKALFYKLNLVYLPEDNLFSQISTN